MSLKDAVVFVDIDTQFDFMHPDGKLYVPDAQAITNNLKRLVSFARGKGIALIASLDVHRADDPEFKQFPAHCVKGSPGYQKIPETQIDNTQIIKNQPQGNIEIDLSKEIIIEKDTFDVFSNPNAEGIIKKLNKRKFVVFGVATDYCVKAAALGLARRGYKVTMVSDAVKAVNKNTGDDALNEMKNAGVKFTTTNQVLDEF